MNTDLVIVTLLVGAGTWAMRFLPTKLNLGSTSPDSRLSRFLSAIGPAAIAALCVAAFLPMAVPDWQVLAPAGAGIAGVTAMYVWRRDVSLATICGAVCYGIAYALWVA